jgi:hypothetical protein
MPEDNATDIEALVAGVLGETGPKANAKDIVTLVTAALDEKMNGWGFSKVGDHYENDTTQCVLEIEKEIDEERERIFYKVKFIFGYNIGVPIEGQTGLNEIRASIKSEIVEQSRNLVKQANCIIAINPITGYLDGDFLIGVSAHYDLINKPEDIVASVGVLVININRLKGATSNVLLSSRYIKHEDGASIRSATPAQTHLWYQSHAHSKK